VNLRPPSRQESFDRVEVQNPVRAGVLGWLVRFYAFALCCVLGGLFLAGIVTYTVFAASLPPLPAVDEFARLTALTTTVRGWDGTMLAEWAKERREFVPFEAIPKPLIAAFLAVEDRRFFEHDGLDLRGIARAALANLRADRVSQGGSTITQQVAKSFLSSERTLSRKAREAILARRIESRYEKNEILALYLNQIFLGHGSYGVAAAARRFFDKRLDALSVDEMALIAGLAGAPSRFSPVHYPERARARRDHVLSAMVAAGFLEGADATRLRTEPVVVNAPPDPFLEISPYFAEHVRRDIAARYGEDALWKGGLEVETTLLPWIDKAAQENVDFSLRKLDKRQGYRGPLARLDAEDSAIFVERMKAQYGSEPPPEDTVVLGLVESGNTSNARVRVGSEIYDLPRAGFDWASLFSVSQFDNGVPLAPGGVPLHKGDVVWVRNAHRTNLKRFGDWQYDEKYEVRYEVPFKNHAPRPGAVRLALEQQPRVQAALLAYDHRSGYVVSMAAGHDFERSQFNRVTQACRQPGSTYKPIYYSLALDQGYGFSSLLNDIPRAEVDPITGEVWTPTNLNNTIDYQVTLEYALIWSKNVPSVQLFKLAGPREVEAWARKLGFTTPIIVDQALALGASCTQLDELTRAFSAFARNGVPSQPITVRRVRNRQGVLIEDNSSADDPMGNPWEKLDRLVELATQKQAQPVIPPRTAHLTSKLLRKVVTHGHAPGMRSTQIPFAGKTGTSSATMDAWFVGYTSRWMLTTWVGDDKRERPLGRKDASFMLTVPMSARFLHEVKVDQPLEEIPWNRPEGIKLNDSGGNLRTTMEDVRAADNKVPSKG